MTRPTTEILAEENQKLRAELERVKAELEKERDWKCDRADYARLETQLAAQAAETERLKQTIFDIDQRVNAAYQVGTSYSHSFNLGVIASIAFKALDLPPTEAEARFQAYQERVQALVEAAREVRRNYRDYRDYEDPQFALEKLVKALAAFQRGPHYG